jgi:hypothetical protein
MKDLERRLKGLPREYHEPLCGWDFREIQWLWKRYARKAGRLREYEREYRKAGGFRWYNVCAKLLPPWDRYAEAWARLLLDDDLMAIIATHDMWGLSAFDSPLGGCCEVDDIA